MGRAEGRARFGAALAAAMEARGVSQTALAAVLGRAQNTVSTWVAGGAAPAPEVVFELEAHLGLGRGALSRHLGYVPAPGDDEAVVQAVSADSRLTAEQRERLIGLFREFIAAAPPVADR